MTDIITKKDVINKLAHLVAKESSYVVSPAFESIKEMVHSVFEYVGINEDLFDEDYKDVDLVDGENKDGNYFCDLASEWADSNVELWNNKLIDQMHFFCDDTQEALEEFGAPNDIYQLMRQGQYLYYDRFVREVLENTQELLGKIKITFK